MSKLKLVTIVGTRPEIIRLSEIIKKADKVFDHILVHTGQNYDYELNEVFFENFGLRRPDYFLNVVGKNLGETLGNVIAKSYDILIETRPDAMLVLGDTNSSLCTIAAKRLKIPIFHMEAGNRCFDLNVPEEINRKIVDHISDINLSYTEHSRRYLISEGFRKEHIFVTGSPLYEVYQKHLLNIEKSEVLHQLNLRQGKYIIVSLHREENVDSVVNFELIHQALHAVAEKYQMPVIFSTHPRTRKIINDRSLNFHPLVQNISPLGYFDYVKLQKNAFIVLSDSGTISEESAIYSFPAISVRTSTERPEAIDAGTIILGGISESDIINAIHVCKFTFDVSNVSLPAEYIVPDVSNRVVRIIQSYYSIIDKVIWNK